MSKSDGGAGGSGRERMVPVSQLDAMVRSRLAEIGAAAGVDHGRVGVEILFKLPPALVTVYELLWDLALHGEGSAEVGDAVDRDRRDAEVGVEQDPKNRGGGAGGRTNDTERSRGRMGEVVVRSGGSSRRAARGASRGSNGRVGGVGSVEASEIKSRADKRLRSVARDIAAELAELGLGIDLSTGERMVRLRPVRLGEGEGAGGAGRGNATRSTITGDAMMRSIDRDE